MLNNANTHLWLRLMLTSGVGTYTARKLLAKFGPPDQIFAADPEDLTHFAGATLANALKAEPKEWQAIWDNTQTWLQQSQHDGLMRSIIGLDDANYPSDLLNMADPPCLLHVLGDIALLGSHSSRNCLAMVGSRNPSAQGLQTAKSFAHHLSQSGFRIVSGLAHGIDTAAHAGALSCTGQACPTLAVVGTGLDRVYPRQNQALAHEIAHRGLLISEYPIGTPPIASNFPKRNRIIAGLARGTLVVEAALESGSLITARLANEQGKDVFAIPGSIHSPHARGCHALIREGAKLVETAQDILDEWPEQHPLAANATHPCRTTENPLLALMGADPIDLETLQARTGLPTEQLQAQLLELELDGQVGRLPGQRFQLIGFS